MSASSFHVSKQDGEGQREVGGAEWEMETDGEFRT